MLVSVVVPVFNEEPCIDQLNEELIGVLTASFSDDWELIYVDDGSTDASRLLLTEASLKQPNTKVVSLQKNLGQTAALYTGFQLSVGDVVVALDGDGQNDPADIPRLLTMMSPEVACVSGWRRKRQDKTLSRRLPSRTANMLLKHVSGIAIHDFGCTLKAYDGDVLRSLVLSGDMHRLLPVHIGLAGGHVVELEVNHRCRIGGISKYGLDRVIPVVNDILSAWFLSRFSGRPMHLMSSVGITSLLAGILAFGLAVILKFIGAKDLVETPLPTFGLILALAGLQLIGIGLVVESSNQRLRRRGGADRDLPPHTIS